MSPELQNKLFEAYPGIFQQRHLGPKHSCMAFGIECGDGWYGIIAALCEGLKDNPSLQACQVKEKYGGLRFYVDGATDVDYELIANAEELSFQVCEICGSSKDDRNRGLEYDEVRGMSKERQIKLKRRRFKGEKT